MTLDGDLTAKLCEASCRPQRDLESLERDERDDVNNRLDGLVLCYAGRFLVPPAGVGGLVATSLDACKDSKMHWRHRLVAGFVLAHLMILVLSPMIAGYGLVIDPWTFAWGELVLLPVLIALASLVGFVPGMTAYRTDVARTLSD